MNKDTSIKKPTKIVEEVSQMTSYIHVTVKGGVANTPKNN